MTKTGADSLNVSRGKDGQNRGEHLRARGALGSHEAFGDGSRRKVCIGDDQIIAMAHGA